MLYLVDRIAAHEVAIFDDHFVCSFHKVFSVVELVADPVISKLDRVDRNAHSNIVSAFDFCESVLDDSFHVLLQLFECLRDVSPMCIILTYGGSLCKSNPSRIVSTIIIDRKQIELEIIQSDFLHLPANEPRLFVFRRSGGKDSTSILEVADRPDPDVRMLANVPHRIRRPEVTLIDE